MKELAIYGGPKTLQDGEVKTWPPVDKSDEAGFFYNAVTFSPIHRATEPLLILHDF